MAMLCGPYALQRLLHLNGIKAEIQAIAKDAEADKSGTSMNGLIHAGQAFGLALKGVKSNPSSTAVEHFSL